MIMLFLWLYLLCPIGAQSTYFNHTNSTTTTTADTNTNRMCCDCLNVTTEAGCSANTDCEDAVCSLDSFCCNVEWDSFCVLDASLDYCNDTVPSTTTAFPSSTATLYPG